MVAQSGQASVGFQQISSTLLIVGLELLVLAVGLAALDALVRMALSWLRARRREVSAWDRVAARTIRTYLLITFSVLAAVVIAYNGWLLAQGVDAWTHTLTLARNFEGEARRAFGRALLTLVIAAASLVIASRIMRRLLRSLERALNRWDRVARNNRSLSTSFRGLERVAVVTAWMLLAVFAIGWFGMPGVFSDTILLAARIYLIVAVGILVIRCGSVIVESLDAWSEGSARRRGWAAYYEHVKPLIPTFRTCLEYALWIGLGSLMLLQVDRLGHLAVWGPKLIQAIALFFVGRVIVALGSLEIGNRMLPGEGLDPADRQRRETMVPLVRSVFTYAVYFGTAVLILSAFGFNPMPFLAGAGILGLVIGFGAQSMINDVVSGFFILFENMFLVGDIVEVGPAKGVVEAIEFRTTKIRDADGRVHVIRNGELKPVINYSKGYIRAVVALDVAYDADLRSVFGILRQAGERLRVECPDVIDELEIGGITAFGANAMTVRTSARVKPGRQDAVAGQLRLLFHDMFGRQTAGAPRKTLIPGARSLELVPQLIVSPAPEEPAMTSATPRR
jgi:small conductance mechanosensitive channel